MKSITIRVKGQAGQYVKLSSRSDLTVTESAGPGPLQKTLQVLGFEEVLVVHREVRYQFRCDGKVPAWVQRPDGHYNDARLTFVFHKDHPQELDKQGYLEFTFRMNSPLAPMDDGVWVRLGLEIENDGLLGYKSSHCGIWVTTYGSEQATHAPKWRSEADALWGPERLPTPAAGNTLLSCAPGSGRHITGNLLQIDPQRKPGGAASANLALYLQAAGDDGICDVGVQLDLSPDFLQRAPVSGYPFHHDADTLRSAPHAAAGARLRTQQRANRNGWTLWWLDVPGNQSGRHDDALTLESLSAALLDQHAAGLATTRSRNRLSLLPTWLRTASATESVLLEFHLTQDTQQRLLQTRLAQVHIAPEGLDVELHCSGALDIDGAPLLVAATATLGERIDAPGSSTLLCWALAQRGAAPVKNLGVGAVLLQLDGFSGGFLQLGVSDDGAPYRRARLVSTLELTFAKTHHTAFSIDPELGFETLAGDAPRDRPWTIDLGSSGTCQLVISETASQTNSRRLSMQLRLPDGGEKKSDVVLVDPGPLTVVRLQTTERQDSGEILAEYIDDADMAPEWQFNSLEGKMLAVLPPQGIGEEMVKGNLHLDRNGTRVRVPAQDELFDFRLTPVARLVLDRTDIDTARSEAPWSLRRLLTRRLGAVGVKLDRADFELLYGMSARLEAPGLRIAELDGFVGRVPLPTALRRARLSLADSVERTQGRQAAQWIQALWYRPSWWRVYADIAQRGRLGIDRGVTYQLRETRETANPFEIQKYAVPTATVPGREPLRGGIDWPFQSRNVYNELEPEKPTVSSGGSIEGLVFGTLGGEGAQTAAFNNGKTLVITTSRQGRIDALTLIRVGRIAMLWNKARHVIVYERTTRRSSRYEPYPGADLNADDLELQPEFPGIAALRKVREYVEITEPRRNFPDTRTDRPAAGPLTRSVFGSTVIPVRSDWGRDLRDGFTIALRGPVPPGREDFFPDPQAFLDFARAQDKGGGQIGQRIRNTERLVFFTSTRAQDGGDSDQWPAWPEVDFPLIRPAPPPLLPFASSFRGSSRQPDAAPVELGMAAYTFSLEPAEEAANLLHARPVKGLDSRIFNINLARGLPSSQLVADAAKQALLAATGKLGASQAVVLDGLEELRNELDSRVRAGQAFQLAEQPQLLADVKNLLGTLQKADFSGLADSASGAGRAWADQQTARLSAYQQGVETEVKRLQDQVAQQLGRLSADLGTARGQASAVLDLVAKQAQQRLGEVGFVPQQAVCAVQSAIGEAQRRLQGQLDGLLGTMLQVGRDIERRLGQPDASPVVLDARWREAAEALREGLRVLPDVLRKLLEGELVSWFSRLPGASGKTLLGSVAGNAGARFDDAADWVARWSDTIAPFDLEEPDFAQIQATLDQALSTRLITDALQSLADWVDASLGELAGWDDEIEKRLKELQDWEKGLAAKIAKATDLPQIESELKKLSDGLNVTLGNAATTISGEIKKHLNTKLTFPAYEGSLDALKDLEKSTAKALVAIVDNAGGSLNQLADAVRQQADLVQAQLQVAGRQIEDLVSQQVGAVVSAAKDGVDAGLQTLRVLAEGPVTDAMHATRDRIGYYFQNSEAAVLLTRASAVFNEMQGDVLNALNVRMPFDQLTDRLKASVGGMAVRDLFPRIAGVDMTYLLPDLDVPLEGDHQYEWLRLQHGFDKDRLRAWAKVSIDKRFESDATLFDLGPVKLRLLRPLFAGQSDIVIEKTGERSQRTSALLNADFELSLNGKPMVTMRDGALSFDESGKLEFGIDAEKIEMAQELKFITDAVKELMPEVEGLTLTPLLPAGVSSSLCLPLPDIGTGAFTMTGITINTHLDLRLADGFEISTGLWLSKPDRPFGLAVLFLGGGGWFGIDATYRPPGKFLTRVSIGVSAGAFIAVNFGFAHGSAGILFTAAVDYYRDWETGSGTTAISLGIIIWGEFSVLGIASASMRLVLRITYDDKGGMVGTGQFSVSIRICWCYTLRVSREARKVFAKGSSQQKRGTVQHESAMLLESVAAQSAPRALPGDYAALKRAADPEQAVDDFLATLAIVPDAP